jgi:hypothetical protein
MNPPTSARPVTRESRQMQGRRIWRWAIVLAVLSTASVGRAQSPRYQKIHEGKHWTWYAPQDRFRKHKAEIAALYDYADKVFDKLCESWGLKPRKDKYWFLVNARTGGGFAAGDIREIRAITGKPAPGIGCAYDAFSGTANGLKSYWAYVLITHEMVNMFTGEVVSGGWPVDWWANHRSPFPMMTAVEIEYDLVPHVAVFHDRLQARKDRLVMMFRRLKDQFGWAMFRKAFRTAREDGVNWDAFGANPSALRTAYVAAYLQLGAPEDIGTILGPLVPKYDAQAVKQIINARTKWLALPQDSMRRKELKAAFLKGDYMTVLK